MPHAPKPFWFLLLLLTLTLLRGASPARAAGGTGVRPLPPALALLLPANYSAARPANDPLDIRRLWAARQQWRTDSLGRLLVFARLGQSFYRLRQADSCHYYLLRAWRLATPAQCRRQPAEAVELANQLALYYHDVGAADSTYYYFHRASQLFRAARLDSTHSIELELPSTAVWGGGATLAGSLANAGAASRALGDVPRALRSIEQAVALYRALNLPAGLIWAQSLLGEAYASQDNPTQALLAYEQAYHTARAFVSQNQHEGSLALAGLLLDYYAPLLLAQPGQAPHIARLAAEARQALLRNAHPAGNLPSLAADIVNPLVRLDLLLAQAFLQAGRPGAAQPLLASARQWLDGAARQGLPRHHELFYPELQVNYLGLLAWQRHDADPAAARRLLAEAASLLDRGGPSSPQHQSRLLLARFCVLMREPGWAVRLLRPLLLTYQQSGGTWPLSQVTGILTQAYAQAGRFDSAYYFSCRTRGLLDTVREGRQFAALAAAEARFRTRAQASQIRLLTKLSEQRNHTARLAGAGAALLALLALALGLAWRHTRRLNRQLAAQAAQLGELDEAKNQFFANVSHELRTPLTLILGPLDLLLTGGGPPLPAAVRRPVELAYGQAQRLGQLVNRILDLTKLRAGRLAPCPAPTALAPWLRRVVGQFASLAAQRGIALRLPAAPPEELTLLLDADKAGEILTNLLLNALNHTPAGGEVVVGLELPGPGQEPCYALTVADTGPGIAAAEQERIFERFYQGQQRQALGGTGLGLALSRELAQLLGGSLTLASAPGQGAAFTLRFPAETVAAPAAAEPPAAARPCSPAPAQAGLRARVLVVEDQPDLREYLADLLAPTCEVLTAADGQAALEVLATAAPVDLLVTDAMMPRLSGIELLAHLRRNPAQPGVPVLMLTARADEAHRLQALTVGVDDYLTKPFVAAELLARVRVLLARQQVRQLFATLPPEDIAPAALPQAPARPAEAPASPATRRRSPGALPASAQLAQWQVLATARLADSKFGPAELADLLCLSERTLYRRLGELTGLTPAAWLRELRLNQARQLLEAGTLRTTADVADAVGFASARYFATIYAERFGRRPSDYREGPPAEPGTVYALPEHL